MTLPLSSARRRHLGEKSPFVPFVPPLSQMCRWLNSSLILLTSPPHLRRHKRPKRRSRNDLAPCLLCFHLVTCNKNAWHCMHPLLKRFSHTSWSVHSNVCIFVLAGPSKGVAEGHGGRCKGINQGESRALWRQARSESEEHGERLVCNRPRK